MSSPLLTLSMSRLACRLRLLKNIFLLRTCISSIVINKDAKLVPMIPLRAKEKGTVWDHLSSMLSVCSLVGNPAVPDGVVVELEQVGEFVEQHSSWFCHYHLLNPHLHETQEAKSIMGKRKASEGDHSGRNRLKWERMCHICQVRISDSGRWCSATWSAHS